MLILLVNSCKKDNNDTPAYFLTQGKWQLASVQIFHFVGDVQQKQTKADTVLINCTQTVVFKNDNTCTFSNFKCNNTLNGSWQIDPNSLILKSQGLDTLSKDARIITLGQYSLVVQTGDISTYYKATTVRNITVYGYVHPN